jgi:hypothetical protein
MTILEGRIEEISNRVVRGWVRVDAVSTSIEFLENGRVLGGTIAEAAGDDGRSTFEFLLPRVLFDGQIHTLSVRMGGNEIVLDNNAHRLGETGEAEPVPPSSVVGHLDMVSGTDGVIGWAWYPDRPDERVEVELLVGGMPVGTTLAIKFRPDLANAGLGDGNYGFYMPLPYDVLAQPRDVIITARDRRSGQILSKPWVLRQKTVEDALSRINELENDVRLLRGTIAVLERRGAQDDRGAAELFKTVGDFFSELAVASAAGVPPGQLRTLKSAVADVTTGLAPFAFPVCAVPDITVFVEAAGPAAVVYQSLRAVQESIGSAGAEVFLLDEGLSDDAPLLPLVVQNMRYARLTGVSPVARRNNAMRLASGKIVLFLSSGVKPTTLFAQALAVFESRSSLAALAARVMGEDGSLINAGIELQNGTPMPRGLGHQAQEPAFAQSGPVDAVAPEIFTVRRATWEQLSGLDEGFSGIGAALVEFCLRAKAADKMVAYDPGFSAAFSGLADTAVGDFESQSADAARLREVIGSFKEAAE